MSACQAVTTLTNTLLLLSGSIKNDCGVFSTTVNANIQAEKSETLFKMSREDKRSTEVVKKRLD